jgi:ceroid-lipofuscinosis MFS transporter 7
LIIYSLAPALNATVRAYVAKVTTIEERTTHIALISLFQSMGFILGPAIQSALTPIGEGERNSESHVAFNLYTATG